MEFNKENFEKLLALSDAVDEWSCDRIPTDIGEVDLHIAIWNRDGDRKVPCPECDGDCGEPCAPISAAQAISGLEFMKRQMKSEIKKARRIETHPGRKP